MARIKSSFSKRLNGRFVRHVLTRATARSLPGIGRLYNVPLAGAPALSMASEIIENSTFVSEIPQSDSIRHEVMRAARFVDSSGGEDSARGVSTLFRQMAILDGCVATGHTRMLLREKDCAYISYDGSPANWNYGRARRLKPKEARGSLFHIFGWTSHYYHFFANETVPLLHYLRTPGSERPLTLLVPSAMPPYAAATVRALVEAYPQIATELLHDDEKLVGGRFLWNYQMHRNAEWMPIDREIASSLKEMLAASIGSKESETCPLVYLSRRDAKIRRTTNEAELEAALTSIGFQTFVPGEASFSEQIATLAGAKVVVATHGAGLTNLLFCNPDTEVVEIFPRNFVKSTFAWLSAQLGLRYRPIYGAPGDYRQHFSVPIEETRAAAVLAASRQMDLV